VQLTASNVYGSNVETKAGYISVTQLEEYCSASAGGDEYISGIQIGTINNTGTEEDDYTNYTNLSTGLRINQSYSIIVTYGVSYIEDDLGIWIDLNQDGDFDDADENVLCVTGIEYLQETYTFTLPQTAQTGATTMRIRLKYNNSNCPSPCGNTNYGEVEDYRIDVLPGLNTWLGTSSDWTDASNWSGGIVPNSDYKVIIPSGISPNIPTGTNAECYNLTLEPGAILTVNGNLEIKN
jgi:hypothetical protein